MFVCLCVVNFILFYFEIFNLLFITFSKDLLLRVGIIIPEQDSKGAGISILGGGSRTRCLGQSSSH